MDPNQPGAPVTDPAPNPYAAPASNFEPEPTADAPASPVKAARIAEVIILASVPAALLTSTSYIAIAIDVLLGISLARGSLKWRPWMILRCVVAALFYGVTLVADGHAIEGAFNVAYVGGLLLLLIGTPGKVRTIVGAVTAGVLALLWYVELLVRRIGG